MCLAYYLRICQVTYEYAHFKDLFHLLTRSALPPTTMSFNITSDGSPTPRKGTIKFPKPAGDLKIDTSPEVLDQAVGGFSYNHNPLAFYRSFSSSLTANMQGAKRPLGPSTLGNQQPAMPQQHSFDGLKVRDLVASLCLDMTCPSSVCHRHHNPGDRPACPATYSHFANNSRSPRWTVTRNRQSWTLYYSV